MLFTVALITLSVCLVPDAMAGDQTHHKLRFRVIKHTRSYDVVKGHSHRFSVKHRAHRVRVDGLGSCRMVSRNRRFIVLQTTSTRSSSVLTVTSPNSGSFQVGSSTSVMWKVSSAVSTGTFRVVLASEANGSTTAITSSSTLANRRKTNYSVGWNVNQAAGSYRVTVYYRASNGRTIASDSSDGLVTISAAPAPLTPIPVAPTPTPSVTPSPTPSTTPTPSVGPLNLNPPDGYVFNGGGTYTTSGSLHLGNNCSITGVKFTNTSRAVVIEGDNNTVRGCTFGPNNWAALMITVGSNNVIDGNTFNTTTGQGGNIQVCGGSSNQVTGNVTKGGITGIIFLYRRSINGGGSASMCNDNVVRGNTCSGMSEEGISFDVFGNGAVDGSCIEYDRVKAVSGNTVTLSSLSFQNLIGYDLCPISGALNGRTRSIVAQSGSTFTLDAAPTGLAVGDEVVIGATFKRNLISGNTVSGGWMTINLYGMCYQNLIENNNAKDIKVESTDNLDVVSLSATKTYGRAPCGYNTVRNNTCSGAVQLQYYAWPVSPSGHTNAYSPYQTVGNNAYGNTCSRVEANEQKCYIAGNTTSGANRLSDVVLSSTEMK